MPNGILCAIWILGSVLRCPRKDISNGHAQIGVKYSDCEERLLSYRRLCQRDVIKLSKYVRGVFSQDENYDELAVTLVLDSNTSNMISHGPLSRGAIKGAITVRACHQVEPWTPSTISSMILHPPTVEWVLSMTHHLSTLLPLRTMNPQLTSPVSQYPNITTLLAKLVKVIHTRIISLAPAWMKISMQY